MMANTMTERPQSTFGDLGLGACLALGFIIGILFAARAPEPGVVFHGWVFSAGCLAGLVALIRRNFGATQTAPHGYNEAVVKAGVIAAMFWGVAGFVVGLVIALQLAFPALNFDLPWTSFGRLRPLHTSAVIFAFGGNVLIATSFYVVQRTCRTRLAGDLAPWFVFWGYQMFILLAGTGYLLGITQSKEYAEPEWYVDLWLTIVWVVYLLIFLCTLAKRREPHIYVANWFYLAFIVTIAMLHVINNLAIPVSLTGGKSYILFSGVQDALTQWWYAYGMT